MEVQPYVVVLSPLPCCKIMLDRGLHHPKMLIKQWLLRSRISCIYLSSVLFQTHDDDFKDQKQFLFFKKCFLEIHRYGKKEIVILFLWFTIFPFILEKELN